MNFAVLSGAVLGAVVREPLQVGNQVGPLARFTLGLSGDMGPDGAPSEVRVPIVVWGRRAQRCLDVLGDGSRVVVFGRLIPDAQGLACFADWMEFVTIRRRVDGGEQQRE